MDFSVRGDFVVHLSYIPLHDEKGEPVVPMEKEQALIIAPSNTKLHKKNYAAIGLSSLYKYDDDVYLMAMSTEIAVRLGIGEVGGIAVAKIINDWMDELCMSKEYEMTGREEAMNDNKEAKNELKVTIDNEVVGERMVH
jgi:hypothetical protein